MSRSKMPAVHKPSILLKGEEESRRRVSGAKIDKEGTHSDQHTHSSQSPPPSLHSTTLLRPSSHPTYRLSFAHSTIPCRLHSQPPSLPHQPCLFCLGPRCHGREFPLPQRRPGGVTKVHMPVVSEREVGVGLAEDLVSGCVCVTGRTARPGAAGVGVDAHITFPHHQTSSRKASKASNQVPCLVFLRGGDVDAELGEQVEMSAHTHIHITHFPSHHHRRQSNQCCLVELETQDFTKQQPLVLAGSCLDSLLVHVAAASFACVVWWRVGVCLSCCWWHMVVNSNLIPIAQRATWADRCPARQDRAAHGRRLRCKYDAPDAGTGVG